MKPNLIFIIGPSCSGKSSMTQAICKLYPEYSVLDDTVPLYQIFNADNLLNQKKMEDFWKFVKSKDIDMYYDKQNPCSYSHSNLSGGYLIDNPVLWNIVLTILGKQVNISPHIIEFSRGNDTKYNQFFNITEEDVYPLSFNYLCQNISPSLLKQSLILNMDASLDTRKKRNLNRYKKGGHLVSEHTMDTIYKKDIFRISDHTININNIEIPVVRINNRKDCTNFQRFLEDEFVKTLNHYRRYHNELQ